MDNTNKDIKGIIQDQNNAPLEGCDGLSANQIEQLLYNYGLSLSFETLERAGEFKRSEVLGRIIV